jgi:hypothetical protein
LDLASARIPVWNKKLIFKTSIIAKMTMKELPPQLLALTPKEKAQAIELLAQSLRKFWSGIEKIPGLCGGDACI